MKSAHLWFLYQQGIELTARFDLYLDEVAGLCSLAESELVQYFRDQLEPIRRDLAAGITELAQLGFGAELAGTTAGSHISNYKNAAARLQERHFDLRFFPVQPPIPPEVYVLLSDFFPPRTFSQIQPVVTYFPDHNFEQLNMYSLRKGGEAQVVLRMPYVEFRNPLMWTNLIHEMGHALDTYDGFSDKFVDKHGATLGEKDKTIYWASEFYADQIAFQLAGPAYLCAFITWHITRDPTKPVKEDKTHPPASQRVFAMKQRLQGEIPLKGAGFLVDVFQSLQELPGELSKPHKEMAEEAYSSVAADKLLLCCTNEHVEAATGMLANLEANTMVSSRRKASREEIGRLIRRLDSSKFESAEDFYSAIEVMQEEANSSCAIINTGWEHRLTTGLQEFYTVFAAADEKFKEKYRKAESDFATRYETYRSYLIGLETRLRKSIEVARLHKLWEEGQNEVGRKGAGPTQASTRAEGSGVVAEVKSQHEGCSLLGEKQILERLAREDKTRLVVTPILSLRDQIQPTSIDLRLGTEFAIIRSALFEYLKLLEDEKRARIEVAQYLEKVHIRPEEKFVLHPGDFALGCTLEYIKLPPDLAGRLEGKSTWGRVGLQIHSTAGYVDPGFEGALTYELQNVGRVPIPLYPGMRVAQICFYRCESSSIPYSEKSDALYGGSPGLMFTQFFRLPDQKILHFIQESPKKKK